MKGFRRIFAVVLLALIEPSARISAAPAETRLLRFPAFHLGKIVGERTWGGAVGIRGFEPIAVDGGFLATPEFAPFSKDGKRWVIEGHGVDPDIAVDNDPAKEFAGVDQQLDRAIEEMLADLKAKGSPIPLPGPPPWPIKR